MRPDGLCRLIQHDCCIASNGITFGKSLFCPPSILALSCDLVFQEFPGQVDTAFNSTQRYIHHVGDFLILIPFEIQTEGYPENVRQGKNGGLDLFIAQSAFCKTIGGCFIIHCPVVRCKYFFLPGFPAVVVDKRIAHDSGQPGLDIGAFAVFIPVGQGPVKGIMDEVFGGFTITGEGDRVRSQFISIADQELIKFYC